MAEIAVRGLRVRGFHGVLPHERVDGQDFLVDAVLTVSDARIEGLDDQLDRTVDYGALCPQLAAVVAGQPVDLIETLASRLLAVCLAQPYVDAAEVTVHKPQAPVRFPFDDVTVRLTGRRTRRTVLSLGSNLGDRLAHLQAAVVLLGARGPIQVSPVYETDPVGGPEQEPYLNAVVVVDADDPWALRRFTAAVERSRGRTRTVRWGPRTLDIDLVDSAGTVAATPELTLPHPRAAVRAFVLVPWLDLEPDATLTGVGRVAEILDGLDRPGVRRTDLVLAP